jgi:hypothetical protein
MSQYIHIIITILALLNTASFAQSAIAEAQLLAKSQIESISAVEAKIDALKVEFAAKGAATSYGRYEFCSIKPNDSYCIGKESTDTGYAAGSATGERSVPVRYIAWGFVLEGDEAPNDDYNSAQTPPLTPGLDDFILINNDSADFGDHLCFEIHFKDSSEYSGISMAIANKTVVLCAVSSEANMELIDIDMIDTDNSDGGKTSHKTIPPNNAGWRCFNPHGVFANGVDDSQGYTGDLGNAGNALGYMTVEEGGSTQQYRMINGILNIFEKCVGYAVDSVDN